MAATLVALFFTGGATGTLACSPCKVRGQTPTEYTDGIVNASETIYQSSAVDAEMLHFPQGRTYDLYHGLKSRPVTVDVFLSFRESLDPDGDPEDKTEPNNLSPSAGNSAVIEVWDEEIIRIRNDTCAEFYLRVVALADPDAETETPGEAGAPSD